MPIHVLLDSNAILRDPSLRSRALEALFGYLRKTGGKLLIPEIVRDETVARYRARVKEAFEKLSQALHGLRALGIELSGVHASPDLEALALDFATKLEHPRVGGVYATILPLDPAMLKPAVQRLIERRKPASPAGEEIRDVLIWLALVEYVEKMERHSQVALITEDKGFLRHTRKESADPPELDPQLIAELPKPDHVLLYPSIEAFLREHAAHLEFLTEEWIKQAVPTSEIEKQTLRKVEREEHLIRAYLERHKNVYTRETFPFQVDLFLDDFYVEQDDKDEIIINIVYIGTVSVGYDVAADDDIEGDYWERTTEEQADVNLIVYAAATVSDGKAKAFDVYEWELD